MAELYSFVLYVRGAELIAENGLGQRRVVTQLYSPLRNFRTYRIQTQGQDPNGRFGVKKSI